MMVPHPMYVYVLSQDCTNKTVYVSYLVAQFPTKGRTHSTAMGKQCLMQGAVDLTWTDCQRWENLNKIFRGKPLIIRSRVLYTYVRVCVLVIASAHVDVGLAISCCLLRAESLSGVGLISLGIVPVCASFSIHAYRRSTLSQLWLGLEVSR